MNSIGFLSSFFIVSGIFWHISFLKTDIIVIHQLNVLCEHSIAIPKGKKPFFVIETKMTKEGKSARKKLLKK